MKLSAEIKAFQRRLGYEFKNPELLVRALTHGSVSSSTRPDNQRLEFLGDRVLGLVIAEALCVRDPEAAEGELAPATWDEALDRVSQGLRAVAAEHGQDSLAFISSSRCTGEENYLMQKLARAAYGTHNIHQCAAT